MGGTRRSKDLNPIVAIRVLEHDNVKVAEREAFAQWLITPPDEREFKTQTAFAEAHGVTKESLSHWKANQQFMRQVYRRAGSVIRLDWIQPIMRHQYEIATSKNVKPSESTSAAKFLIAVMEVTMSLEEAIEDAQRPIEALSLDELREELAEIVDIMDEKIERSA